MQGRVGAGRHRRLRVFGTQLGGRRAASLPAPAHRWQRPHAVPLREAPKRPPRPRLALPHRAQARRRPGGRARARPRLRLRRHALGQPPACSRRRHAPGGQGNRCPSVQAERVRRTRPPQRPPALRGHVGVGRSLASRRTARDGTPRRQRSRPSRVSNHRRRRRHAHPQARRQLLSTARRQRLGRGQSDSPLHPGRAPRRGRADRRLGRRRGVAADAHPVPRNDPDLPHGHFLGHRYQPHPAGHLSHGEQARPHRHAIQARR